MKATYFALRRPVATFGLKGPIPSVNSNFPPSAVMAYIAIFLMISPGRKGSLFVGVVVGLTVGVGAGVGFGVVDDDDAVSC